MINHQVACGYRIFLDLVLQLLDSNLYYSVCNIIMVPISFQGSFFKIFRYFVLCPDEIIVEYIDASYNRFVFVEFTKLLF